MKKKLMKTVAEPGVMLPGVKGCLESPETGKRKEGVFLRACRVSVVLLTTRLVPDFFLQNCERVKFLLS